MSEFLKVKRVGYDVDDTLVGREWPTRVAGSIRGRWGYNFPEYDFDTLPELDPTPIELPNYKPTALWFHKRRRAILAVSSRLRTEIKQGKEVWAISGRAATLEWHAATSAQFVRERIPIPESRIRLTPRKVPLAIGKAVAIKELGIEEFSDDNLTTQLYLSGMFPDRIFNWVRYQFSDIAVPEELIAERPNLNVIPISRWRRGLS